MFALLMEDPVLVEISALKQRPEAKDSLAHVQAPSRSAYIHAFTNQMSACALNDAGSDRSPDLKGKAVVSYACVVAEVLGAGVDILTPGF